MTGQIPKLPRPLRILNDAPPAAAPTPVITGPGEYRTRGGWKATWRMQHGNSHDMLHRGGEGANSLWSHTADGRYITSNGPDHLADFDILGPWIEPKSDAPRDFPLADAIVPEPEAMTTEELYQALLPDAPPPSEPFRITGPGKFRNHVGEQATVTQLAGPVAVGTHPDGRTAAWYLDGKEYPGTEFCEDGDLISPWREPRTAEVSVVVSMDADGRYYIGADLNGKHWLADNRALEAVATLTLTGTITENQNHTNGETK